MRYASSVSLKLTRNLHAPPTGERAIASLSPTHGDDRRGPARPAPHQSTPRPWRPLLGVFFVSLLTASTGLTAAVKSPAGIDVVLVMDSSGSMKQTDPERRRVAAAKLFIALLGSDDRVGVISFSDAGYPVIGLTPAQAKPQQEKLFKAVDKVSSKGAYTNLHAALQAAHEMLAREGSAGRAPYILLMSDGKMDTGDRKRDAALGQKIHSELLPRIEKQGARVYALAFTAASDSALMQAMAAATHGLYRVAPSDKDLHAVFATFFESSKSPDMLPIDGGRFQADSSIEEVNIVASKENADVKVSLEDPDGQRHSAALPGSGIRWMPAAGFDLITVPHPKPGTWKLLSTSGQSKAYIVTDLSIATDTKNADLPANAESVVQAWLSRDGVVVTQKEILASTQFLAEIKRPDGKIAKFSLFDNAQLGDKIAGDGIYAGSLDVYLPGAHELRLIARNPTFERSIVRYFNVLPPAEGSEPPVVELPTADSATPAVTPPPAAAEEPPAPTPEPEAADTPEDTPPPVHPPEKTEEPLNLWVALGVFTVINLIIGGIAAGVVFWLRKKKIKTGLTDFLEDKDGEDGLGGKDD